jgi:heme/copper-type cytochrome/quinol oxidase subunit 2
MKSKELLGTSGALAMLAVKPSIARACAVCVTGTHDAVSDAFNWSVLFLMATPYLVVGSIAGALFYAYRRAARKTEQHESQPAVHLAWNHKESGR